MLDSADGETVTWGAYNLQYQAIIEQVWQQGNVGMEYKPGKTQIYVLDFVRMVQRRTSSAPGFGSERTVRRIFVPNP